MIGAMVNIGKQAYVSQNFHSSLPAIYNILLQDALYNRTYFTELVLQNLCVQDNKDLG